MHRFEQPFRSLSRRTTDTRSGSEPRTFNWNTVPVLNRVTLRPVSKARAKVPAFNTVVIDIV